MENKFDRFINISKASIKANKLIGSTVEKVNDDALLDAAEILTEKDYFISFGVKNTGSINRKYIQRLLECNKYVWHTIDKMSDRGRAIDVNIINPLTGNIMTGSSSGTAINVLYGINDIGIGTDGGGSILAPALSVNLFSVMAKGMGLKANKSYIKKSTDGIEFLPGIGVISHSLDMAIESVYDMINLNSKYRNLYNESNSFNKNDILKHHLGCYDLKPSKMLLKDIKIAVPKEGNIKLPQGMDMTNKLKKCIELLKSMNIDVIYEEFPDFKERHKSIEDTKKLIEKYDILITYEGPMDTEGTGDSVFGIMGEYTKNIQNKSGKYMVKVANMLNATAVTIPSEEAASGLVMLTREGVESGLILLELSRKITNLYRLPQLYYDYFKNSNKNRKNELIFSKEWSEEE